MKTRTPISKESAGKLRKPKKPVKKDRPQPKDHVETKKPRPQVQQNRFTNILELSTLSASLMQLHDLFGTLVLDFSQDPVQVKISDVTGNYELNVSKESLNEFKLKFLLGQNTRGKPAVTIFLGECQCYPELPEGALELEENQNDDTTSLIDSIVDDSKNETKVDVAIGSDVVEENIAHAPTCDGKDGAHEIFESDEIAAPLLALFEGEKAEPATPKKNLVTYETHHISASESSKLELLTKSDELVVKMRPKKVSTKLKKPRPQKKPDGPSAQARKASKSPYKSNLEGFVKFLMTDKVCSSLLDKMKTPENVAHLAKRISGQKLVNYSDGQEFRVCFTPDKSADAEKNSASNTRNPNSRGTENGHTNDGKPTDGIKVLFERTKPFEKASFVEQVKKEVKEWHSKGEQTVNVEIVEDSKSSSSTEDSDSNVVTVYEDPKTSKKLNSIATDFDDASSNGFSEGPVDPPDTFCLELKDVEMPEIAKEDAVVGSRSEQDVLEALKPDRMPRKTEQYVTPIDLETVSTADIEAMWMKFVEIFHQKTELVRKLSSSCHGGEPSTSPVKESNQKEVEKISNQPNPSSSAYPGQHYLPYFVEESLKRVNSALGNWCNATPFSNIIVKKTQEVQCPPQVPSLGRFNGDITPGNNFSFNPKHFDVPMGPPFHRHPTLPAKFSTKKSRIFFNPHVSIGDWY